MADDEDDVFPITQLVPVSEWVYYLYKVELKHGEHGKVFHTSYIASSYEGHLMGDIDDLIGRMENIWYQWERVSDDPIGHHRVVGNLYGRPLYESGREHGQREADKRGLKYTR